MMPVARMSRVVFSIGVVALLGSLAVPLAADASTLTYTATGGIITGSLGGTPFTNATWSITGTGDSANVISGTDDDSSPFNFLAMTPLLTITTGSSTLQATMVTDGSIGQQVGVFSVDFSAVVAGYGADFFGYLDGNGSTVAAPFGLSNFGLYTDLLSPFSGSGLDQIIPTSFDTNVGRFSRSGQTDQASTFTVSALPEPSTCAMALAGLACGGYSLFRRRRAR
jgi:hypothetical protein